MSMISAQIDELRQMADGQATYRAARAVMLQAADTIWELRDDLQRANVENATLRQQIADVTESMGRVEERCAKTFEVGKRWMAKAARFEAENTKLRELVADVHEALCSDKAGMFHKLILASMEDDMRELGIEVTE